MALLWAIATVVKGYNTCTLDPHVAAEYPAVSMLLEVDAEAQL